MRIACIHIPQFALQCATRLDPSLRGAPVAVVSGVRVDAALASSRLGVLHAPVVLACSRAAWALGVRLGMTAVTARSQSPKGDIAIVTADLATERETTRAIADAVLAASPVVDLGGRVGAGGAHLAMYCEVPAKTRGTAFGDKLVELLAELGLQARIGIADDRFTAWVAAAYGAPASHADHDHDPAVVMVPRGGSAAFLAPRSLSLLAIPAEVQHMLESLGVTTLGAFAALPAPSVARPFEADYQALARGESGASLRLYHPDAAIREEIVVSASTVLELPGSLSGPAAIAQVARRIALRLAGRGRGAARLDVSMLVQTGELREVPVTIDGVVLDAEEIARVLAPVLDTAQEDMPQLATHGGWRLRVVVSGEALVGGEAIEVLAEGTAPFVRVAPEPTGVEQPNTAAGVEQPNTAAGVDRANRANHANHANTGVDRANAAGVAHPKLPIAPPPRRPARHPANANESRQTRLDSYQAIAESGGESGGESRGGLPGEGAPDLFESTIDPLAIVLSSSGSLFALSPPGVSASSPREEHRRTRRGKQRRARPTPQAQPRLFDRTSSK